MFFHLHLFCVHYKPYIRKLDLQRNAWKGNLYHGSTLNRSAQQIMVAWGRHFSPFFGTEQSHKVLPVQ